MNTHRLMPVALLPAIKDAIVETGGCFQPESLWAAIIAAFDQVQPPLTHDNPLLVAQREALGFAHDAARPAPIQSGDVRNQALEEAAKIAEGFCAVGDDPDEESINLVLKQRAQRIRALASTPSAAMQGQGVPEGKSWTLMPDAYSDEADQILSAMVCAINLQPRAANGSIGFVQCRAAYRAALAAAAPTPPAAQPQAGGRELTDADIQDIAETDFYNGDHVETLDLRCRNFARAIESHITGTKGATE